jgi:hypothetical protein
MFRKIILIPLLFMCVAGCSATHIESNKDNTYQRPLNRVLICLSLKNSVYDPLLVAKLLSEKLGAHGVLTQVIVLKDTESEGMQAVVTNASNTYKPNQILTVLTTEDNSLRVIGGMGPGAQPYLIEKHLTELDITVHDVALQKNIWRAIVNGRSKPIDNSLADTIIQKLDADGLLPASAMTHKTP